MSLSPPQYSANTSTIPLTPLAPAGCIGIPSTSLNGEWMTPIGLYSISLMAHSPGDAYGQMDLYDAG